MDKGGREGGREGGEGRTYIIGDVQLLGQLEVGEGLAAVGHNVFHRHVRAGLDYHHGIHLRRGGRGERAEADPESNFVIKRKTHPPSRPPSLPL